MEKIDGELTCAICLEFYQEPLLLPCGHNFCKKCIQSVIENGASYGGLVSMGSQSSFKCPVCQKGFSSRSNPISHLPRNKVLENVIEMYVSTAPVDIFDTGWNSDLDVKIPQCHRHGLPMERYCRSCNLSACEKCETEHHQGKDMKHQHKIFPIKDVAAKHQAEIAEALTEIKKRSINLNTRLQQVKQLQQQVERNEKSLLAQLDHHTNTIMSAVRKQQEDLKQRLKTDFTQVIKPVEDELRRCNSLKTSIHQLMKKVADIKRTMDTGLRISLMIGARKQLNSLLCFDIAWSLKEDTVPEVDLPTWTLDIQHVLDSVNNLQWDRRDIKTNSNSTQTGAEHVATVMPDSIESQFAKIPKDSSSPNMKPGVTKEGSPEDTLKHHSSLSAAETNTQIKAKKETTFGLNNDVTPDDKPVVKPKVKSEPKESTSLKSSSNDEMTHSENLCQKESMIKVFTAEKDELSTPDTRNKKKENKKLSPSERFALKKSSSRGITVKKEKDTRTDIEKVKSAKMEADWYGEINSENEPSDADLCSKKVEVAQNIKEDISEHSQNGIDSSADSVRAGPKTGARPKCNTTTKQETNNTNGSGTSNINESGNTKPKSDKVKLIEKSEPMEVAYSFDYDENDVEDDKFLSQSLNKLSFNTKKEDREEMRKSFPPDPQVGRPVVKPKAQVTQRLQKPKQRSPHQDAVAKFVARRRTGSPHIPKTVSSQSLQTMPHNVEFPKTLSSPVLSELSVKGDSNGAVANGLLSRAGKDEPACMKFI